MAHIASLRLLTLSESLEFLCKGKKGVTSRPYKEVTYKLMLEDLQMFCLPDARVLLIVGGRILG